MELRDYQQTGHNAVVASLRKSLQPIVVAAATGSGKSHMIAAIAKTMREMSGKGILVIAPNKELVEQDAEKYAATGNSASVYCASAGSKCLQHPVVFGSPITVRNGVENFAGRISTVVLDEAHVLSPTVKGLIETLRESNEFLRVVGLTATPYRLGQGYIYRESADGRSYDDAYAKDPYFAKCVYEVNARELIDRDYLTEPVIGAHAREYDTANLQLDRMNRYDAADLERAFEGKGRLTAEIMADVVEHARDRMGVMVFATTVRHAEECLAALPPDDAALVTGKTPKRERAHLLERFKARKLKFLVNVSVLTTGFDAPHVDLIAILRPTESVGLLQQIVGRGLRVHPEKTECVILDYAGNIAKHCPQGDIFDPQIKAHEGEPGEPIDIACPQCGTQNTFAQNKLAEQHALDEEGWCTDLRGRRLTDIAGHPVPGHTGRRCQHRNNRDERCTYRWQWKDCPACDAKSDIAARYCETCGNELIDPNEKLKRDADRLKAPPCQWTTEDVVSVRKKEVHAKGKTHHIAEFKTPTRQFSVFFFPHSEWESTRERYARFKRMHSAGIRQVTYKMDSKGYYRVKI